MNTIVLVLVWVTHRKSAIAVKICEKNSKSPYFVPCWYDGYWLRIKFYTFSSELLFLETVICQELFTFSTFSLTFGHKNMVFKQRYFRFKYPTNVFKISK